MAILSQTGISAGSQAVSSPRSLPGVSIHWALVIVLAIFSVRALQSPQSVPSTAPDNEFSAERALVHVREISRVPHPLGSPANDAVRSYLVAQLSSLGLQPQVFSSLGVDTTARSIRAGKTNDIIGRLPGRARLSGTTSGPAIMLMAHYDSVYRAPGAGDDASGVATILEVIRALRTGPALQRDIIVLLTDGEEAG